MDPLEVELRTRFQDRCRFDHTERLLYSHDVASLPEAVARLVRHVARAVVQPENAEEVAALARLSAVHGAALVPRGAGTSGYGGALPARDSIVVDFTRMSRVLGVDPGAMTATVEPGVVWTNLEAVLGGHELALRLYPTSAPGSTVGGWVAGGGAGIGSYEYGTILDNVVEVEAVLPSGQARRFDGEDLRLVAGLGGSTGFITRVTLRVRPKDRDVPVLAALPDVGAVQRLLEGLADRRVPLWHVSFHSCEYTARSQTAAGTDHLPADRPLVMVVYPASRTAEVEPALLEAIAAQGGEVLPETLAAEHWAERYYPMRLKRLGPSLIPSEAVVPTANLEAVLKDIGAAVPGLALEGQMIGRREAALLGFLVGDERTLAFTLGYAKSLLVLDIARKHGGRPYAAGLFFTADAAQVLGPEPLARAQAFKRRVDPGGRFNPGKVFPGQDPTLRRAMGLARVGRPVAGLVEKLLPKNGGRPADEDPLAAGKKGQLPADLTYHAFACAQCGYCRNVCTLFTGRGGWESASPRGKWYALREYVRGRLPLTGELVETFLLCTTCKRCNDVCQVGIPIQELWDKLRGVLVQGKGFPTFPPFEMMAASFALEGNIWAAHRRDRDAWLPEDVEPRDAAPIGYWAGCTASYLESDIARNAVRILRDGGMDFAYMRQDEWCCGVPFLVSGKWDVFEKALRHNVGEINRRGIETLVVSCPGCWVSLEHYYREWAERLGLEWNVKVRHITEVAADLVREGKLEFKQPVNARVTWHDPCHIGRHGGIYEPPRQVIQAIPGVEFVEMAHNRADGLCCGSVLTRVGEPDTSDAIASARLAEAEEVGADLVATTCPCCEFQLRVGGRAVGREVPVVDFATLVARALGYPAEDPTEAVHRMWAVFDRAIQLMTVEGMAWMMEQLMPEMIGRLPGAMNAGMGAMRRLPRGVQDGLFGMMESLLPAMMPKLMDQMLPKLLPDVVALMEAEIPDMPPAMRELMPRMMPRIMKALLPRMLPEVLPRIKPRMMQLMKEHVRSRAG